MESGDIDKIIRNSLSLNVLFNAMMSYAGIHSTLLQLVVYKSGIMTDDLCEKPECDGDEQETDGHSEENDGIQN